MQNKNYRLMIVDGQVYRASVTTSCYAQIYEAVQKHPGITTTEIGEKLGLSAKLVSRRVFEMAQMKNPIIRREVSTDALRYRIWPAQEYDLGKCETLQIPMNVYEKHIVHCALVEDRILCDGIEFQTLDLPNERQTLEEISELCLELARRVE